MKTSQLIILISTILFLTSCKDDSINPVDLTGEWQSEEIHVNGILQEDISKSTWLSLRKDNTFYKNYVVGTWSLNKRNLALTPGADTFIQPMQHEITHVSNASLTVKRTLTEREYGRDFEGVEADEIITVTEKYKKMQ